jgi:sulfur-oxidizing protein SoxY
MFQENKMSSSNPDHGLTRRQMIVSVSAATFAAMALPTASALAGVAEADAAVQKIIGGRKVKQGGIKLELPEIAENGATVPLTVSMDSPMTAADHVQKMHFFADGNPNPDLASFNFTPHSGVAKASIRIRLAKTQNIVAVAETSDGSVYVSKAQVKVTIGGCGG